MEFQKMQQSLGNMQGTAVADTRADSALIKADSTDLQAVQTPLPASRKRKFSSDNDTYSRTIRGSLQAMQARIVAEIGVLRGGGERRGAAGPVDADAGSRVTAGRVRIVDGVADIFCCRTTRTRRRGRRWTCTVHEGTKPRLDGVPVCTPGGVDRDGVQGGGVLKKWRAGPVR